MLQTIGRLLMVFSLITVATGMCMADTVETTVERVSLFKNGLALFIREGTLPEIPGEVEIGPLAAASHGTFWLGWDRSVELSNLSASKVEVPEQREALTIQELLQANVGKRLRLEFGSEHRPALEGELLSYPQPMEHPLPNPYMAGITPLEQQVADVLLIREKQGVVAVSPHTVDRIIFLDDPNTMIASEHEQVAIRGNLVDGAGERISVSYLAKGITWAPSYLIDVTDPKKAKLTAKATIINEIEDLERAQLDLITGFPYLEFAEIITPLAKKEDLASFLNALGRGHSQVRTRADTGGAMAQVMSNVAYSAEARRTEAPPMPDYGAASAGEVAEDLFYYPVEDVTLKRGATGYYPLFTASVDYEHLYTWDIPDYLDVYNRYRHREQQGTQQQIVWHSLRLQNDMKLPWTTAPAETMQESRILGQAMLKYTPPAGEAVVKITQALGLDADQIEVEISNEPNAYRYRGDNYDRVTIEGTLSLRSFMNKDVIVEITKLMTGTLQSSTVEPEVTKLARPAAWNWWWHVNPHSKLKWKVPIKVGEDSEIEYTYEALVRH